MQINITGHHVDVTLPLKDYVTEKLDRIQRHFDHITNINVILSVEKKYQQKAEARINLPGADIFAESESEDMYAAIDTLIDKLDKQVIKHKEKITSHAGNGMGDSLLQ